MPIEFRKEFFADERDDNLNEIGKPTQRQDMIGHVTGRSPFYDDHLFDGLLHIRCVRSPHHHARIRSIDVSQAERMPGVKRVILGKDVPHNLNTLLSLLDFGLDDEPLIAEKKVSYKGEPVAAIVADSERAARDAVAKVRVDWEVLPHVLDVEEAIKPNAPVVNETYPKNLFIYHNKYDHQKLRYGDVEAAFREADHIVEGRYQMSPIEQAPTETCGAIAAPENNNRFVCYTSTQALFFSLGTAAKLLELPSNRMHFIGGTVGGGFGGKVDSLHEPLAILGVILTGRPCKYMFDRAEEMQVGAPRGAERWYIKDGVMKDGRIIARQ
ncbi:MAG: molybdopterin cofactor-binding domain-containing protein, partial [Nitratireductor sp.]